LSFFLLDMLTVSHLKNKFSAFIEPEGWLPCSKESAMGLCLKANESSLRFRLISLPKLHPGLPNGLFPSSFQIKVLYAFLPWVQHPSPI
jgi:hypothetical protein